MIMAGGIEQTGEGKAADRASYPLGGERISSEEADAILQELANHDDDAKKTWSRLFVENYLSNVRPCCMAALVPRHSIVKLISTFCPFNSSTLGIGLVKIIATAHL